MKVILVDDEWSALTTLRHKLLKYDPFVDVIAACEEPGEAIQAIRNGQPDVLFLDIEMPRLSGFDLLSKLPKIDFEVIFVTAHDEFTVQAIRVSAFDYLLKPIDEEEFQQMLVRLKARLKFKQKPDYLSDLQEFLQFREMEKVKKLPISTNDGVILLPINEIVRLEAMGSYTALHLANRQKFVASKTLAEFSHLCRKFSFYKVHKSHIVNLSFVEKYIRGEGGSVILSDGSEIGISRRVKAGFLERLLYKNGDLE